MALTQQFVFGEQVTTRCDALNDVSPEVNFRFDDELVTITFEEFRQMKALIVKFEKMEREFAAIKEHLSKRSTEMAELEDVVNSVNAPVKNVGNGK